MPSTYSNLKIELMATGENDATWGTITNTNLGTAIEEAIAGSADVTFASGNVTLTLTDSNASQTARNMRLRCIGTTGGSTRNLNVPAIEKLYLVHNECADGITVKTVAGTGITVPAGQSALLFVDGTNVVSAVSYLASASFGSPLAVASGGTGGNTQGAARTGLGATTVGSNLFTLANPSAIRFVRINADNTVSALNDSDFRAALSLGTAALVDVPITVPDGGTGGVSFTANTLLKGNGTGALQLSSISDDGSLVSVATNIRFSASNPTLEFNNGGAQVYSTAANTLQFATGGGIGSPTERMRITSSGDIGIGTSSPGARLDVNGNVRVSGNSQLQIFNSAGTSGVSIQTDNAASAAMTLSTGGSVRVTLTSSGVLNYGSLEVGYRDLPTAGGLTRGQCWHITSGQTINTGLSVDGVYAIYNNSGSPITLTEGSGLTLRRTGTTSIGNRTLLPYGYAWIRPISSTEYTITGDIS
jgi:hypothetical protein